MLQNTEDLAKKRTYELVCQGTSVNVICYMAQQRKYWTQYGNESSANYHNATIYLCSDPMVPVHLQN